MRCGFGRARSRGEIVHVNADRERASDDRTAVGRHPPIVKNFAADMLGNETPEISEVNCRLKADDVELEESLHKPVMGRNSLKQFRRRERYVQEKTESLPCSLGAKLRPKRYQMIIVGPHKIVRPKKGRKCSRKALVDALVALEVSGLELNKVKPVMTDRP